MPMLFYLKTKSNAKRTSKIFPPIQRMFKYLGGNRNAKICQGKFYISLIHQQKKWIKVVIDNKWFLLENDVRNIETII